ncbi:UNVERIFIED_CONTAM: hypothetical protein Scaly_1786000 [Sesamum calycinum]|uniref:Transposase n=1 Tax=Sesamum calycinum TaxID=2727403 RepID=A0AAW2NV03_9LAMI
MVLDATGLAFWSSNSNQDGAPNDGTRLADQFHDVVHVAEQSLWNGYTQSQLGVVSELVDIEDDIDLDYCKFCGEARYKPIKKRNPNCKKTPYAILRRDLCEIRLMQRHGGILTGHTSILQRSHIMLDWVSARMGLDRTDSTVARILFEPLIEELQNLWHVGILTLESAKNETFTMCAMLMWTVNDLPTYGMTYGWSTTGVIRCPVRIEDTCAFYL